MDLGNLNHWYISDSPIHGQGIFARKEFKPNDIISIAFIQTGNSGIPAHDLVRTEFCKYINHNNPGNSFLCKLGNIFFLKAKRKINPDEEIHTNYNEKLAKLISGGFPDHLVGNQDSHIEMPHYSHLRTIEPLDLEPIF